MNRPPSPWTAAAPDDPRRLAWVVLQEVEAGAHADARLAAHLNATQLEERDRALATRLVYGTLAQQGFLDHVLTAFASQPLGGLDVPILVLLRLGLFQLCSLDRVPAFAAVDTAVRLAKGHRGGAASGLVNAILRRAANGWRAVPLPAAERDPSGYMALRHSHPRWFVERLCQDLGNDEAEALLRADNEVAPTVLRARRGRIDAAGLVERLQRDGHSGDVGSWAPDAVQLTSSLPPERLEVIAEGLCSAQGEASQLVAHLAAPAADMAVLDLCAAPGGKACALAELMDDRGIVVAVDINRRGIARLQREAQRLGLTSLRPCVADATLWQPAADEPGNYDVILVDAPCSGFGTLRQHPEIRWRRDEADVRRLAVVQQRLLDHALERLRPNGALVYATCTLTAEENEAQVARLCQQHGLRVEPAVALLPPQAAALVDDHGCLRTYPHRHGLDGFYAARLRFAGSA